MEDVSKKAFEAFIVSRRIVKTFGASNAAAMFAGALVANIEERGEDPVEVMMLIEADLKKTEMEI